MGDTPVIVPPPTMPARGKSASSIDLRPGARTNDVADAYTADLLKAMNGGGAGGQGAAYRTRANPVFNHTRETAGIRDSGSRMTQEFRMLRSASMTWAWKMFENTRVSQCVRWFSQPTFRGDVGWRVALARRGSSPTRAQRQRMEQISRTFTDGGSRRERPGDNRSAAWDSTWTRRGEPLHVLLVKCLRDLLTFGQCAIEIEASRKDPVAWMAAMDASKVRMVRQAEAGVEPGLQAPPYVPFLRPNLARPEFVVLDDAGNVNREYGFGELLFKLLMPVSDVNFDGYGLSLLELVIELLVAEVLGIRYNREAFVDNKIGAGALLLRDISQEQREGFEQIMRDNVGGGPGKWFRMPVILGEGPQSDAQWIAFNNGLVRQDMMWQNYIQWVMGAICAVCSIAMEEMGFTSPMSGAGALNNPDPQSRISNSQDKGLVPLLELCCAILNEILELIEPSGDFVVVFDNLRPRDAALEADLRQRRLDTITTIDEERAWDDLPKRRIPTSVGLWNLCMRVCATGWGKQFDDQEIDEGCHEIYYKSGGEYSISGMIPTNPAQMQVVTQEIGSELSPEDERDQGMMDGQPGQMPPGQFQAGEQQGDNADGPPHFPPGTFQPNDEQLQQDDQGQDPQDENVIPIQKAYRMLGSSTRSNDQRYRVFEVHVA